MSSPSTVAQDLSPRALEILERLVAFDTTSRLSNLALVEWVEAYLDTHGVPHRRVPNAEGTKSNLMATIGPDIPGGVVLSGHTDVVPVDGQPWTSDPFQVTPRGGRLYGRGTCDMKGFLALALAAVPDLQATRPKKPVHLAFSYDEEVGCLGAPDMIRVIATELPRPALVVVGEPTNMEAVSGHKGITTFRVAVTGHEAHSSQTQLGLSANMIAIRLMGLLCDLAERLEREADPASPFTPRHATLTVGQINGGTVQFLVDTGATSIALPSADARRLGINYLSGQRGYTETANGKATAYKINLDSVKVGDITLYSVEAVVLEGDGLKIALLGMSFLNRTEMRRDGQTLTLTKRF